MVKAQQEIEQYVNNKVDELSSSITSLDNTLQAVDSKVDALEESKQDVLTNESTLGTINGIDFNYGNQLRYQLWILALLSKLLLLLWVKRQLQTH